MFTNCLFFSFTTELLEFNIPFNQSRFKIIHEHTRVPAGFSYDQCHMNVKVTPLYAKVKVLSQQVVCVNMNKSQKMMDF